MSELVGSDYGLWQGIKATVFAVVLSLGNHGRLYVQRVAFRRMDATPVQQVVSLAGPPDIDDPGVTRFRPQICPIVLVHRTRQGVRLRTCLQTTAEGSSIGLTEASEVLG